MTRDQASGEVSERELFAPEAALVPVRPELLPVPEAIPRIPPPVFRPHIVAGVFLPKMGRACRMFSRAATAALALELDRGTPFLFVPVFLGLGAVLYYGFPYEPAFQPMIGGTLAMALLLRLVPARHQMTRLMAMAVLVCLLGGLVAKVETWRAGTAMLGGEISTRLTGRVVEIDHMANGRVRLTIDVVATAKPKLRYAPERVRVSARKIPSALMVGSQVEGAVRLMPPSGPVRPESYDFSFRSYFDGIGASGFFLTGPTLSVGADALSANAKFFNGVENVRNAIADRIRAHIGGPEGEIAAALVVGIRAGIPEDINEAMRRTGIYHIISISGLHMALVAGTVMSLLRVMLALFPGFASRHPVKKYAASAALLAIAGYLFISGGEVAAQRSFLMLAIMLTALLFDRGALTTRNLAISALVIIVISPHEVVGPSFQMSFAATAALVAAYAMWSQRRHARKRAPPAGTRSLPLAILHKGLGAIGALLMTSLVAGLATTAFGAYHFQRVSPLSLIANLAVMPSVSLLVMPFGVLGSLAMPLGLDAPFFYVMGKGLTIMIAVSQWISERSPIDGIGLISLQSLILLTIALVVATMTTTWLRILAVPFALAGLFTLTDVRTPDVLVSEDGRLVGVAIGGEELAVNRPRPNAFTIEDWKRALRTEKIVGPIDSMKAGNRTPSAGGFDCHDGLCIAEHGSGAIIVHAVNRNIARQACDYASLIVIDDATVKNVCAADPPLMVTKRELAKFGSAAIYISPEGQKAEIRFALSEPYRPWHMQRQFSREARGKPPYKQKQAPAKKNAQTRYRTPGSQQATTKHMTGD